MRTVVMAIGLGAVFCMMGGEGAQAQTPEGKRPSESDLFGAPTETNKAEAPKPVAEAPAGKPADPPPGTPAGQATPPPAPTVTVPPTPPAGSAPNVPSSADSSRDSQLLGDPAANVKLSAETAPEDPLKLGGLVYMRAQSSGLQGQRVQNYSFSAPAIAELYLDARPNDRVRGYVLGRMAFDSTAAANGSTGSASLLGSGGATNNVGGSVPLSNIFSRPTRGPTMGLDQFWLRFDIAHTVFVTTGRQHVRWGTARFWAPTDYLHLRKKNPLESFDARTGTSMVKLHVPWEAQGWNFYAYGVTEGADATPSLQNVAGAARAEIVLGTAEVGLGAFVQKGQKPKLAADLSTGIGDVDLYGEVALRYGSDISRIRYDPGAVVPPPADRLPWVSPDDYNLQNLRTAVDLTFPQAPGTKLRPQAVGGANYSLKYNDNDVFTVGAEYFYNGIGYDSPKVYPGLIFPHSADLKDPATFFYLGKHYAAVFASLPAPWSLNYHSFTVSTIGNLSDQSFVSRLDYSLTFLTHLRLEAFAAVHYGHTSGEFRFGIDSFMLGGKTFSQPPSLFDLGVALRVSI